ncbi:YopX family protein [Enterococcus sp. DIV0180]|uniref:YopX family protein n=1 Tax=Enterococcus sp. DIV0180 TaxID=2774749 RepID=UPI003D2FEA4A
MIPKFRVFNKSFGEWLDAQEIVLCNGKLFRDWRRFEDGFPLNMRDCDVMQSTGLKDINGVEIFEGDVVVVENHPFQRKEDSSAGIEIEGDYVVGWNQHDLTWCAGDLLLARLKPYVRVIGNIYENPDLLEAE